ncbi:MAG TPA: pyridoxamine 5'-phosphate oxidase family protein [Gaiellaceae bacterium]
MPIERATRSMAAARIAAAARRLLDASTLCAIATVSPGGRAHVNTAYFAWSRDFDLVWLSEPHAAHSRNLRAHPTVAVAVYDSHQTWGKADRGIQLFGSARELVDEAAADAERIYAKRFPDYGREDLSAYRFYRFRPRRVKLFDESAFGRGVFVTARIAGGGKPTWERTEIYQASERLTSARRRAEGPRRRRSRRRRSDPRAPGRG